MRLYLDGDAAGLIKTGLGQLGVLRHSLALGGLECGAQRVRLPSGAVIETLWDGTINVVRILAPGRAGGEIGELALFMETGYLDLRPVFPVGGGDRPAAKLYLSSPQLERLNHKPILLDWLLFYRRQPDLILSLAGHRTRQMEQGMESRSVGAADAERPTAEKRDWLVPSWYGYHPTNRTGKLKLLLQAVMGRDKVLDPACALGPLRGLDKLDNTIGLFSYDAVDRAPAYAVIQIVATDSATTISACPLEFDTNVAAALLGLSNEDRELAEGYWLSTTAASGTRPSAVVAELPGVVGAPFAYGWKFNRKGGRASIVTAERIYSANETRIEHYLMRRYLIEIEEDGERTPESGYGLSATLTMVEGPVACTPRTNGDLLWYPSVDPDGISKLRCFYWEDRPLHYQNGPTVLCDEVPMYCFYGEREPEGGGEKEEKLIVVRFFTELAEPIDTTFEWLIGCGLSDMSRTDLYRSLERYNAGFYLTEEVDKVFGDMTGSWVFQDIRTIRTVDNPTACYANWYYLGCDGQPYPTPAPDCGLSGPPYVGWLHHTVMGTEIRRRKQWIETSGSETLLIIPFGDAEGCYLGSLEQKLQNVVMDQISVFDVIVSVVGPGAIDLPVQHQQQGGSDSFSTSYDAVYQRVLIALLAQHDTYLVADKVVESGKTVELVENPVWTDIGDPSDEMPSEFNDLFNPVLFGIEANPWHRPMTVYESDKGLITYERLNEEVNMLVFAASDERLPYTEWFSAFVGWA